MIEIFNEGKGNIETFESYEALLKHIKAIEKKRFEETGKEFIFVEVDGGNTPGGSYYVNSKVIGDWETYTTTEVVSYLDENYRTIADRNSRGICGFSMGGFGAINLAFRHPDIYGAVYTMSPGIIAEDNAIIAEWENGYGNWEENLTWE